MPKMSLSRAVRKRLDDKAKGKKKSKKGQKQVHKNRVYNGRKPGSKNKKTELLTAKAGTLVDRLHQANDTPLEIMLRIMVFYENRAKRLIAAYHRRMEALSLAEDADEKAFSVQEDILLQETLIKVFSAAKECAPFMHPKLNAIAYTPKRNSFMALITDDMTPQQAATLYAAAIKGEDASAH